MRIDIAVNGFVIACALGCGGGGGALPPPAAPQVPSGTGWVCFSEYAPEGCSRTKEDCEKNEAEYAKSIGGGPTGQCKQHSDAYCYTAIDRGTPIARCYPSMGSCESRRDPVRNLSGMASVSACAVFR